MYINKYFQQIYFNRKKIILFPYNRVCSFIYVYIHVFIHVMTKAVDVPTALQGAAK